MPEFGFVSKPGAHPRAAMRSIRPYRAVRACKHTKGLGGPRSEWHASSIGLFMGFNKT